MAAEELLSPAGTIWTAKPSPEQGKALLPV